MKFHLLVAPEAEADVSDAFSWYEEQMKGLGRGFLSSIEKALQSIQARPARFPIIHKNVRRALLHRFPYALFFVRKEDSIVVIAVLHQARDPRRWKLRYAPRSRRT
jgi:plasmid stabilization system protein ParE